jgi:AcrR family transcriptional regulator
MHHPSEMTPRAYDMSNRERTREEVRARILEATLELHTERGILGTSWRDIAERADVAVTTVYNHFPSLDELVPACGDLLMARLRPPGPDDAADVVGSARSLEDRVRRAAVALFDFYERGGAHLDVFPGERDLPAMQEWEAYQRATVEAFAREALGRREVGANAVGLVSALLDLTTFRSFERRGFGAAVAADAVAAAAVRVVERDRAPSRATGGRSGR